MNEVSKTNEPGSLHEALAPQITAGAHFARLAGPALDGSIQPLLLPSADSKLLIITFSPSCPWIDLKSPCF